MQKIILTLIIVTLCSMTSFAQVGINNTSPDPSAALDISSSTQGLLIPRLTTQQRNSISSPAIGLFIYNTDDNGFQYYKGTGWSTNIAESSENKIDCASIIINGINTVGSISNSSTTITIDILVEVISNYTISTNTLNGYSYSASGIFPHLGVNTITLSRSGSPINIQIDTFTVLLSDSTSSCSLDITVL